MFGKSPKAGGRAGKKHGATLHDMQESSPEQKLSRLEDDVAAAIAGAEG